ncbi:MULTISPECIES: dihydrofolate reductase [Pelosinus]|uniref:dihydrofolate reductase n=2 Tax=Pelosinus TaxID=365348 RepID=I9LFK4_9FIRM|nr:MULTISPECIES: dihydrofolate reductase [Pelosinus]EIW19269.1 dihydrofolate reductase region [Pelosinus fermentans B4]EIW25000.1 dihydrofolate reductase region [Pelosinus fermentans A11]
MKLIVAVDEQWGIGCKGQLLVTIPADMQHFKEKTKGKVIVMGRETFESLPGSKPLQGRINIVLTKNIKLHWEGVTLCHSLSQLFTALASYRSEDIFIIGGESVYRQCLPYCSEAYVTKISNMHPADTCFPNLDSRPEWQCIEESSVQSYKDSTYRFTTYINLEQRDWREFGSDSFIQRIKKTSC